MAFSSVFGPQTAQRAAASLIPQKPVTGAVRAATQVVKASEKSPVKYFMPSSSTPTMGQRIGELPDSQTSAWDQAVREVTDPRYQTTIGMPRKAETTISKTPSLLTKIRGRLDHMRANEPEYRKFIERNSAPARFFSKTAEDVGIGLKNFVKNTTGLQAAGNTQEELILAGNMRKQGMHTEADQMLEEIQERRLNHMTERELEDSLAPVSAAEQTRRAITQGIAEFAPTLLITKGAGVKGLAGGALKKMLATEAAESFAFTALRHDYENTPFTQYPQEFFDDFKYVLPMSTALKVGGGALSEAGQAFAKILSVAKKSNVNLSPEMLQRGIAGEADETFESVWRQLQPQEQFALKQEFQNHASLRENRPIFAKGGKEGIPGKDFPAPPPEPDLSFAAKFKDGQKLSVGDGGVLNGAQYDALKAAGMIGKNEVDGSMVFRAPKKTIYHGTDSVSAEGIRKNGFKPGKEEVFPGQFRETGSSFTTDKKAAQEFADFRAKQRGGNPEIVEVDLANVKKFDTTKYGDADEIYVGTDELGNIKVIEPPTPKRTIPLSDTVKQEFRMDKLNLLPKDETKVQAVLESLGLTERGVQTFDEMREIASTLGTDPEKLVRGIMANGLESGPQVLALRDTINSAVHFLSNKQAMLDDAVTPAQKSALMKRIAETERLLDTATEQLVKGGTAAGRTVVAYRLIARNTLDPAYWLKEAKSVLGDAELNEDTITAITSLIRQKDRIGLAHFVAGLKENTPVEKMLTLWKAGLLTSPTTHLANVMSNVTMQSLETVKDVPATVIDWGVSKFTGTRSKAMTLQGFVKQAKGVMEGTEAAIEYFKTGIDRDLSLTKYDIPRNVKFNNAYVQMYVDGVFRALGAVDKVSRYAVLKKSLYEQAVVKVANLTEPSYRQSIEELSEVLGRKATKKDLIESFFHNPDEAMSHVAINDAEFVTFTRDNEASRAFRDAKRGKPTTRVVLEAMVPFVRTPTNVALAVTEYSPVGFLMSAVKGIRGKGQKEIIESFSRGLTGTAVMAAGAALARDGLMTSTMPADKRERELWEANGIQAQSIFVGGKWRRLDRLSPIGNLLTIGAEFNRFGKERSLGDRYAQTALGGLKGLTEQSFLKGLSAGMRAITEPDRYAAAFVENAVGGLVPSVLGRIAQGLDTKRRDKDTIMDVIQSRIPILAEQLPASVDPFGREIKNRQSFFTRVLDPFNSSGPTGDPVAGELYRLKHPISVPNRGLYSPEEYRQLLTVRGKILNPLLYATMSSNVYNEQFSEDQKTYAVDVITTAATTQAQAIMRQKLSQRLAKELMGLPPAQREARFKDIQKKDATTGMMLMQLMGPPSP